ncbi:hypothetical protein DFQ01_1505 [Paenibacillus cellulosilyticus]|uniref:Uncharacterized protein n=1 Tax=Paenibacillus cellulosilyticus TaxID=375489 RepID=A0A2V2YAR0_9BACL|nr:hypothetical protein [Paenibacillus cellulosilyticus]PWV88456.1 hypothetical protein DFQ01_1505 [Paenibacillus cellulosilyticus]QKS44092.1 hypothetical protein HUB94_06360 [Paenibacillus cellulosilyticus]
MPTEGYVRTKFNDGMNFEHWVDKNFRDNYIDLAVLKRTDVSDEPHKHEDIKDVPSEPDLKITLKSGRNFEVWVTHKKMDIEKWERNKNRYYLPDMYWRYKTVMSMESEQYLLYGIYDANRPVKNSVPHEIYFCQFNKEMIGRVWKDEGKVNQDDWRRAINMSSAAVIFNSQHGFTGNNLSRII